MFRDYFIENIVMVMDVENRGLIGFPFKAVKAIIDATRVSFCSSLHKLYVLNPSFSFNFMWKIIKSLLDKQTVAKIHFAKKEKIKMLLDCVDKGQLLKRYGGDLEEPKAAFPVICHHKEDALPVVTEEQKKDDNYIGDDLCQEEKKTTKCNSSFFGNMDEGVRKMVFKAKSLKVRFGESDFSKDMINVKNFDIFENNSTSRNR